MYNPASYDNDQEQFIKRLGAVFDTVPNPLILINTNGEFSYINRQGRDLFGLDAAAPVSELKDFRIKAFAANGAPYLPEDIPVNISLKSGKTVRNDEIYIENLNGIRIPALLISTPVYDLGNNLAAVFAVFVDMSERKRVVEKLNFQAHLLSNVQEAISAYDKDMKIIYWNEAAEKMYGWTAQETFGKPADEIFSLDVSDSPRFKAVKKMLLERNCSGEAFVYHKSGSLRNSEVRTKILTDKDGAFSGAVAAFRDITRRKQNELKIKRQRTLLRMINAIYEKSLLCDTLEGLGLSCLEIIESATKSAISFVGDIGDDGRFQDIALRRAGCDMNSMGKVKHGKLSGDLASWGLFGAVLTQGKTIVTNAPKDYPMSEKFPHGHPEITSFLGTPFLQDGKVHGIVAVANREGGYTEEEKEMLEALTPSVMEVLQRKRAEEALEKSDERLTFLLKLSDVIRPLTEPAVIQATASGLLAQYLIAKISYIDCRDENSFEMFCRDILKNGDGQKWNIMLGLFPTAIGILRSAKTVIVDDFLNTALLPAEECERVVKYGVRSNITFPLLKDGNVVAVLSVSGREPRHWTQLEVSLVQETAERTWTAVECAQAAEALRKREEQFRALVTASSEVLFRMSPDCKVMTQLHGQSSPRSGAKHVSGWIEEYFLPEDWQQVYEIVNGAIKNKSTVELEHRVKLEGGGFGWTYTRAVPLLDGEGNVVEWFGSTNDITSRKKADAQLLQNKLRNDMLASITSRLLLSENPQQIIYDICSMAMKHIECDVFFNYFVDNSKGRLHLNAVTGISEEDAERFEWLDFGSAVCGCVAQAGKRIIAECIPETPDRRTVEIAELGIKAYACHPLKTRNATIGTLAFGSRFKQVFSEDDLKFMSTIADYIAIATGRLLTNQRLKESEKHAYELVEQLKKEDQNKNNFLSILSHELRNPLATIMAGISVLDITKDERQGQQAKEVIKRQSNQLCRLVDDLLDITRITQNKIRLRKEHIDLNRLAKMTTEDMRAQFEEKDVRLEKDISSGPLYLEADPARISQIIGNLLHNALKFTQSGGYVKISVRRDSGEAVISVKDNGIGLKEDMLGMVLQPFIQVDESLERSGGGLGLGLAITKGICELHGGTISAHSAGLGEGSMFEIRLPVNPIEVKQPENRVPEYNAKRFLRILVIEDNKDFAELLCSMFRQIGHEAAVAFSGPGGLREARTMKPDIIFCDIGLPDMNGYEVARIVRQDDEIKYVYLVALTGYATQQDVELAAKSGFDKHVAKPVNIETLQKILNQFCQRPQ